MTKIKYIHCFGTSYTAGGGFEFDSVSDHRRYFLKSIYGHLDENFTQYSFSYPGQLQKLLGKHIKVFNHGKNGYGNELLYRKIYDIVSDYNFNPDENIFLLEISALGRKEFWLNEINDYIIVNYKIDWDNLKFSEVMGIARSYWYDSIEMENLLENNKNLFNMFFEKFKRFVSSLFAEEQEAYETLTSETLLQEYDELFYELGNLNDDVMCQKINIELGAISDELDRRGTFDQCL
jgi:hypothetical protein